MKGDNRKDTIFTERNVLSGETKDFRSKKSRWPRLKLEKELRIGDREKFRVRVTLKYLSRHFSIEFLETKD